MSLRDIGRSRVFVRSRRLNISKRKAATRSGAVIRPSSNVRPCALAQHCIAEQAGHRRVLVDRPFGRLPLEAHHDHVVYRFRRIDSLGGSISTEAIAAKAEFSDVAPTIRKDFTDSDCTGDDFIPAIGLVTFGIDLFIARKAGPRADPLQCYKGVELARPRDAKTIMPYFCDSVSGVIKLPVHGPLHRFRCREHGGCRYRRKFGMSLREITYVKLRTDLHSPALHEPGLDDVR